MIAWLRPGIAGCALVLATASGAPAQAAPKAASKPAANPASKAPAKPASKAAAKPVAAPWRADSIRPGTIMRAVADSIAERTTFAPVGQAWFVAAVRGKRLLLDIGRVDMEVRKDSSRARAYRLAIPAHSTVPVGARFRLRGAFGDIEAAVTGYDVWASRVVATLALPPHLDSLARRADRLTASAWRLVGAVIPVPATPVPATPVPVTPVPVTPVPVTPPCALDSLDAEDRERVKWVRDSLEVVVREVPRPAYTGVSRKVSVRASQAVGCFGIGRVVLAVALRDDRGEWFVERLVILDDKGRVVVPKVADLRFRTHDILGAYDADGDGIDDLATRAATERAGATTILRFDPKAKKFERLAAGFAWEEM